MAIGNWEKEKSIEFGVWNGDFSAKSLQTDSNWSNWLLQPSSVTLKCAITRSYAKVRGQVLLWLPMETECYLSANKSLTSLPLNQITSTKAVQYEARISVMYGTFNLDGCIPILKSVEYCLRLFGLYYQMPTSRIVSYARLKSVRKEERRGWGSVLQVFEWLSLQGRSSERTQQGFHHEKKRMDEKNHNLLELHDRDFCYCIPARKQRLATVLPFIMTWS